VKCAGEHGVWGNGELAKLTGWARQHLHIDNEGLGRLAEVAEPRKERQEGNVEIHYLLLYGPLRRFWSTPRRRGD